MRGTVYIAGIVLRSGLTPTVLKQVQASWYWSGTEYDRNLAWNVDMRNGAVHSFLKYVNYYV